MFFLLSVYFLARYFYTMNSPRFSILPRFLLSDLMGGSIDKGYVAVRMRETGALFASPHREQQPSPGY